MRDLRTLGSLLAAILLSMLLGAYAHAQPGFNLTLETSPADLPDSPGAQVTANQTAASQNPDQPTGTITGSVMDMSNGAINGALVVLETESGIHRTAVTNGLGGFQFTGVSAGGFRFTVTAAGFATYTSVLLRLEPGQFDELSPTTLQAASAVSVDVTVSQHEVAAEQIELQEKQRVLGAIPNFYVSYIWNAAPLSSGQKYRLALRNSIDPATIIISAGIAGVQQWTNDYPHFGQGAQGYGKRFGANYADTVIDTMVGGAVFASIFHQDPRYFYKGTGSISSRALYAISTVVICKGDNGHWQPNYSNVLGNIAAAEISKLYYPDADTDGPGYTVVNALLGTAEGAIGALFQEFLVKKISRGVPTAAVKASTTSTTHP